MSFTRLEQTDLVVSSDAVTAPAWSTNVPQLTTFEKATPPTSSFYTDIYQTSPGNTNAAVQFSIIYGHSAGSGSAPFNTMVPYMTPSKVNYQQYKALVYGDTSNFFNFGGVTVAGSCSGAGSVGIPSFDVFVLNIDRNRYKESLFPGTFNLKLSDGSNILNLTDNSNDVSTVTYLDCGRAYDIVSGSNGSARNSPTLTGATKGYTVSGSYGLFLPDVGLIVLNPRALSLNYANGGFGFTAPTTATANSKVSEIALYTYMTNAGASSFTLNSKETVSSDYVFVRIKNGDYNYTTNPSFTSGSGDLVYSNFIYSPQTYITTVGLYNDNNELLAVAKLSKPLIKDFTKECLIRVKLDW